MSEARKLADRVLAGETRAGARLMSLVDDASPIGLEAMAIVHREGREAILLGVTGSPGAGKSTLIDALIAHYRGEGKKVGVVAVDPTSPISGGAVLADRVRMQRHALDEGVFVRSLASRGHSGGLSASASAAARVLEGMGFDVVIVETVGIGQTEVEIANVADSVIVVLAPGMGDEVQAMKAGLLEVPDVLVVNKGDREGAELVVRDLEMMVHLHARGPEVWAPPIVKTVASTGEGIGELAAALAKHRAHLLAASGVALALRRKARARLDIETAIYARLRAAMLERAGGEAAIDAAAERVASRASDPWAELEKMFSRSGS